HHIHQLRPEPATAAAIAQRGRRRHGWRCIGRGDWRNVRWRWRADWGRGRRSVGRAWLMAWFNAPPSAAGGQIIDAYQTNMPSILGGNAGGWQAAPGMAEAGYGLAPDITQLH